MDNKEKKQPKNDASYTPQEDQFADGKGTQLHEAMKSNRGDIEDELSENLDAPFKEEFEEEELNDDYEQFKTAKTKKP